MNRDIETRIIIIFEVEEPSLELNAKVLELWPGIFRRPIKLWKRKYYFQDYVTYSLADLKSKVQEMGRFLPYLLLMYMVDDKVKYGEIVWSRCDKKLSCFDEDSCTTREGYEERMNIITRRYIYENKKRHYDF